MKKLITVLCLAALAGCYNDKENELYPQPATPPPAGGGGDTVSFAAKVKPIIDLKCATAACHDATAQGGYNFTTYNGVKQAIGRIKGAINWEPGFVAMPQGQPKLDPASIGLISKWIDQGALNN